MFDAFKAFMRGWNDKGAFSHLSPELCRPYTNIIVTYFDDQKRRMILRMSICDSDEETLPFDFSYEVLPLSIAMAMAHIKGGGDEQYRRFITTALSSIAVHLGQNKPEYEVCRILKDPHEVAALHRVYRATGSISSVSSFARTPFSWATMLDVVFPMRSVAAMEIMLGCQERDPKKRMISLATNLAHIFLAQSTGTVSRKKETLIAEHIARLFFDFFDIPPYKKRA